MRPGLIAAVLAAAVLLAPGDAAAQSPLQSIPFPGGVTFQFKRDEMTDRLRCAVVTPMRGAQVAVQGTTVEVRVHADRGPVARDSQALMRIDAAPPFALGPASGTHRLAVPPAHVPELLRALYARRKVVVRFYQLPGNQEHTFTLEAGDFGNAHAYASSRCGWPSLDLPRQPLPKEPAVYRRDDGSLSAVFAEEWWVVSLPNSQSCTIRSSGLSADVFNAFNGKPDDVLELGELVVLDVAQNVVARISHPDFAPGPIRELLRAARAAGEYGTIRSGQKQASLYGFLEAARFVQQSCRLDLGLAR